MRSLFSSHIRVQGLSIHRFNLLSNMSTPGSTRGTLFPYLTRKIESVCGGASTHGPSAAQTLVGSAPRSAQRPMDKVTRMARRFEELSPSKINEAIDIFNNFQVRAASVHGRSASLIIDMVRNSVVSPVVVCPYGPPIVDRPSVPLISPSGSSLAHQHSLRSLTVIPSVE